MNLFNISRSSLLVLLVSSKSEEGQQGAASLDAVPEPEPGPEPEPTRSDESNTLLVSLPVHLASGGKVSTTCDTLASVEKLLGDSSEDD